MSQQSLVPNPRATLRYWIGLVFLKFFGWRVEGMQPEMAKCVFIAAPHTSYWDTPFMLGVSYIMGVRLQFMVKHTMFWGPFGAFFHWLGGIPIDRRARHNTVDQCIQAFQERDHFILTVPPEGTRSQVDYWKTGFYHIAHGAGVPIVLGFLDFKRKVGGLGPAIWTTGDIHADVARIREFYLDVVGKNPELMSEIRVRPEAAAEVEARRAAM